MVGYPYATNQAILGALARLRQLPPDTRLILWLVLDVAVLALAVHGMRRALRADDRAFALSISAGLALLVSPISWGHHGVYAVPALLVMAVRALRTGDRRWGAAAALATITFVVAPFQDLARESGRELDWSWWKHLVGNPYGRLTISLLVAVAWSEIARLFRLAAARPRAGREVGGVAPLVSLSNWMVEWVPRVG
jgi:alpha-1,2-mannosyltransferase